MYGVAKKKESSYVFVIGGDFTMLVANVLVENLTIHSVKTAFIFSMLVDMKQHHRIFISFCSHFTPFFQQFFYSFKRVEREN